MAKTFKEVVIPLSSGTSKTLYGLGNSLSGKKIISIRTRDKGIAATVNRKIVDSDKLSQIELELRNDKNNVILEIPLHYLFQMSILGNGNGLIVNDVVNFTDSKISIPQNFQYSENEAISLLFEYET